MFQKTPAKQQNISQEGQDTNNLVNFLDLLLKIDRRNHPELYQVHPNSQKQSYD